MFAIEIDSVFSGDKEEINLKVRVWKQNKKGQRFLEKRYGGKNRKKKFPFFFLYSLKSSETLFTSFVGKRPHYIVMFHNIVCLFFSKKVDIFFKI